jgi:hypothetical protein
MRRILLAAALLAAPSVALAQAPAQAPESPEAPPAVEAPALPPAPPAPPASAGMVIPKNTPVVIALSEAVGSNTNKPGDRFAIVLAEPVMVDGKVVLPAGLTGVGEVVHSAASGLGGRSGELLLAARYLDFGDTRIPLKAFQFAASGRDTTAGSLWAMGLVKGGQVIVPEGARGAAKIGAEIVLPAAPPVVAAPTTSPQEDSE